MIHLCNNETIKKAISIIDNGGIIVYPTDTLYGFGKRLDYILSLDNPYNWTPYFALECYYGPNRRR